VIVNAINAGAAIIVIKSVASILTFMQPSNIYRENKNKELALAISRTKSKDFKPKSS
jgi:hypothetical protein